MPSTPGSPCTAQALDAAEVELGARLPDGLRVLYNQGDGRLRMDGEWWVVWPLERLVSENRAAWGDRRLPTNVLAFGDDGTGNPFCVFLGEVTDEVVRWSWIDGDVETTQGPMTAFLKRWVVASGFPCPCCGFLTYDDGPGDDEFCAVCGWQDDLSQLRFASMGRGANRASLREAQMSFLAGSLPSAAAAYDREPEWRPLLEQDIEVPVPGLDYGMTYADDLTTYYYWRGGR